MGSPIADEGAGASVAGLAGAAWQYRNTRSSDAAVSPALSM